MPDAKPQTTEAAPSPENMFSEFKNLASKYLVPMADSTIKDIVGTGEAAANKLASFEDYLKTTAKGLFPALGPQIESGIPTAHLLDPFRQVAKQMLGEDYEPDFVNDMKATAALHGSIDEATGRPRPMTLDQWKNHIMTEPGFQWSYSQQARDRMGMILSTLHRGLFGGE